MEEMSTDDILEQILYVRGAQRKIYECKVEMQRCKEMILRESCKRELLWARKNDNRITAKILSVNSEEKMLMIETTIYVAPCSYAEFFMLYEYKHGCRI